MTKDSTQENKELFNKPQQQMSRINRCSEEIGGVYHNAALKLKLSDSALAILYALRTEGDECGITDICRAAGMSKQTINSSLRKLEQDKIVFLKAADGRKKTVVLTEKGTALAKRTADRLIEAENRAIDDWGEEEVAEFLRLLQQFLSCLKKEVDKM